MNQEDYDDEDSFDEPQREGSFWQLIPAFFDFCIVAVGEFLGAFFERCESMMVRGGELLAFLVMPWRWFAGKEPESEDELFPPEPTKGNATLRRVNELRFAFLDNLLGSLFGAFYFLGDIGSRLLPRRIFWPLYWCLDGLIVLYEFFTDWWYSREFPRLLYAAPAIVLAIGMSSMAVLGMLDSNGKKMQRYTTALTQAEEDNDDERSALLKEKLRQLGFGRLDDVEYSNALALAKNDRIEEAYAIMKELAPLDKPGLLAAHLWIAGGLLDGVISSEPEPWPLFDTHVGHALTLDEDNQLARRFEVELLARNGRGSEAVEAMESLADTYPDLHAALAHEHQRKGNTNKARSHARRAIAYFRRIASENKSGAEPTSDADSMLFAGGDLLSPTGCLRLAESFHLVDDFDSELALLETAAARFPDLENITTVLVSAQTSQLERVLSTDQAFSHLVESIFRREPENKDATRTVLRRLLAAENDRNPAANETSAATLEVLEQLGQEGVPITQVLQMAGDFYLIKSEDVKAVSYYRRVCNLNPEASFAWNNLAAIWGKSSEQLNNALKASDRALALRSDPRFYETRGQILFKLKRYADAIRDLESAVSGAVPNPEDAHRSLMKSYEALGQKEQAAAHRAMLNTLSP